jgi:hypothetical protein
MIKIKRLFILCGLLILTCAACVFDWNNHNINISVNDGTDYFRFFATYNKNKTANVQYFINKSIAPNKLFASTHDYIDAYTELQGGTKFYIKSSRGKLKIEINKKENSEASYLRIKNMCAGIKNVLTDK